MVLYSVYYDVRLHAEMTGERRKKATTNTRRQTPHRRRHTTFWGHNIKLICSFSRSLCNTVYMVPIPITKTMNTVYTESFLFSIFHSFSLCVAVAISFCRPLCSPSFQLRPFSYGTKVIVWWFMEGMLRSRSHCCKIYRERKRETDTQKGRNGNTHMSARARSLVHETAKQESKRTSTECECVRRADTNEMEKVEMSKSNTRLIIPFY